MKRFVKFFSVGMALLVINAFAYGQTLVSVVRSDYPGLQKPADPKANLSKEQIESLVRKSLELIGGIGTFVKPDHKWILIKPNIVEPVEKRTGDITNCDVVRALVRIVHEAAPSAKISIAEGPGGWISPGHPEVQRHEMHDMGDEEDGWKTAGYRDMLKDPALSGIKLELLDLNFDESVELPVPGGGGAMPKYFIPKSVLNCDVFINVPVMKVTNMVGMTNAMKNMVGIAPGLKYGWSKMAGYPPGSGNPGLPHNQTVIDKMIVDLVSLARINLNVVDAIVGIEKGRMRHEGGKPLRMNTIIAGSDPVAVDVVSARLVGWNPDDFEFITLGEKRGIGVGDLTKITIKGQSIEQVGVKFEKKGKRDERGHYGQSNRTWILKGPFKLSDAVRWTPDPKNLRPVAGEVDWSEPVYFQDDKLDLSAYYKKPTDCVVYAYTDFTAPKSQDAELWIGSEEGLKIWLNGDIVYSYTGSRRHRLPNDRVNVNINQGKNSLLVEVIQTQKKFDFSLNLCQLEKDPRYDGTRVFGLKFTVPVQEGRKITATTAALETVSEEGPQPEKTLNNIPGTNPFFAGKEKKAAKLEGFPLLEEKAADYTAALQAVLKYKGEKYSTNFLTGLSGDAFKMFYAGPESRWLVRMALQGDPMEAICQGLGYSYAYSYNASKDSAITMLKGWISLDYPVIARIRGWMGGWCVIVGFEDDGKTALVRTQMDKDKEYRKFSNFTESWGGWGPGGRVSFPMFVVGNRTATADLKSAVSLSLKKALEIAKTDTINIEFGDEGMELLGGLAAYRAWLTDIAQSVKEISASDNQKKEEMSDTGEVVASLLQYLFISRLAASEYIAETKSLFPEKGQEILAEVSKLYGAAAMKLKEGLSMLPQVDFQRGRISEKELPKLKNLPKVQKLLQAAYENEESAIGKLGKLDLP